MTGRTPQWFPDRWTQLRLPRLFDDDEADGADRWSFAIVALDGHGRMALPAATRAVFADATSLRVSTRGDAVVVRRHGPGHRVAVDGRGRIVVPRWLRDAAEPTRSVLVATRSDGPLEPLALVAPTRVLHGWADTVVGER
jgi:hypothetical protein